MVEENNGQPGYDEGQFPEQGYADNGQVELESGAPSVSADKGRLFIILGGFIAFVLVIAYILSNSDESVAPQNIDDNPNRRISRAPVPEIPDIPIVEPPTPPVLAPPIAPPALPTEADTSLFAEDRRELEAERRKRLHSQMLIASDDGSSILGNNEAPAFGGSDENSAFANATVASSKAQVERAGKIKHLDSVIAQGKVIEAVLETAINTQLPGMIRAIVSRDTYAESGMARLIPKGSRLVGVYNTRLFRGQNRVFVMWTRVIRPDGIDMMINSPGADALGRAGIAGHVDNRYDDLFGAAILTSIISIGVAGAAEEIAGDSNTTTTTSAEGNTTTNSTPTADATRQGVATIGAAGSSIIRDMLDQRQTITVDQGTRVNILVNKDLLFPSSIMGKFVN